MNQKSIRALHNRIGFTLKWSWPLLITANLIFLLVFMFMNYLNLKNSSTIWTDYFLDRLQQVEHNSGSAGASAVPVVHHMTIDILGTITTAPTPTLKGMSLNNSGFFGKFDQLRPEESTVFFFPDLVDGVQRVHFVKRQAGEFVVDSFEPRDFFPIILSDQTSLIVVTGGVIWYSDDPRQIGNIYRNSPIHINSGRLYTSRSEQVPEMPNSILVITQDITNELRILLGAAFFVLVIFGAISYRTRKVRQDFAALQAEHTELTRLIQSLSSVVLQSDGSLSDRLENLSPLLRQSFQEIGNKPLQYEEHLQYQRLMQKFIEDLLMLVEVVKADGAKLRESETRFHSLIKNGRDNISLLAADGTLLWESPYINSTLGYPPDQFVGRNILEIINPEDQAWVSGMYENLVRSPGLMQEAAFRIMHASGTWRWIECSAANLLHEPSVQAIVLNYRDITERKRSESALIESQALTNAIVDSTSDLIWSVDPESHGLQTFNHGLRDYFLKGRGIRIEVGMRPEELFPPGEYVKKWHDFYQKALGTGTYIEEYGTFSGTITLQLTFNLLERDGKVFGISVFGKDITERKRAELILRESESRFRAFVEQSPVSIGVFNLEGNGLYANHKFLEILGMKSVEEMIGRPAYEYFAPQFREQSKERTRRRQLGLPVPSAYESVAVRADGSQFPAHLAVAPIQMPEGTASIAFLTDISDRKRAEELILQNEKKYRELFQVNKDGIAIFLLNPDGSPSRFIEVNDAAPAMLGYTREEMLQLTPMALEPDTPREQLRQRQADLSSKGLSEFETTLRHKNGLPIHTEFTAQVVQYDGRPAVMNIVRDVSERKHAEKTLVESESRFREVLENSLDASYKRNLRTNTYDYLSPVFLRISGYTPEEFINLPVETVLELIHPDDRAGGGSVMAESLYGAPGSSYRWEYRFKHKDGQYRWLHDQFTTIRDEQGEPAAWIGSVSDITERKQRENELQTIADLSAILRSASTRAKMLPIIVEQLVTLLHCDAVSSEMLDPLTNETIVEAAYGEWDAHVGLRQPSMTGLNAFVMKTKKPYYSNDFDGISKVAIPEITSGGIHSVAGVPLIAQHQLIGILWMGRKTEISEFEVRLLASVADMTANALHRATLHEQTQKDAADLAQAYDTTLEGWARALELRDQETEGHARRVVKMTLDLAAALGIAAGELENVRRGALLHDIGKMGIPDSILLKPGSLDEREWEIMRQHPEHAHRLMEPIEYLRPAIAIPYCHHEKWDGTGYPQHLKGEEIPLEARIFAIVDVWDALTSDRPYRLAWSRKKALEYIVGQSNTHFDPQVVEAFLKII